jgi:hypothetical protein
MLKFTMVMMAIALAGTANAAGWRSLRLDASSEAAFEQSVAVLEDKLSPGRRYAFSQALKDIWIAGTQAAEAEGREYTAAEYYRQLDGSGYKEVVRLLDPTGQAALRYRAAYNPHSAGNRTRYRPSVSAEALSPWAGAQPTAPSGTGPNWRGGTPLFGPSLPAQ